MAHTPPKGSLEDLFRHHLLESEAAAVPPRSHVWEQLDNSLLLAQNEKYRRRLLAYRWAVAASLLLASLAGGGWWQSQRQLPGLTQATGNAAALRPTAARPGAVPAGPATTTQPLARRVAGPAVAVSTAGNLSSNSLAIAQPATFPAPIAPSLPTLGFSARSHHAAVGSVATAAPYSRYYRATKKGATPAYGSLTTAPNVAARMYRDEELRNAEFSQTLRDKQQTPADAALLAARLAQLNLPTALAQPALRPVELPAAPAAPHERTWQFGLAYATSAFQPNIDFAKDASAYNPALGINSATLTQAAAAEYRSHLRAGLGQRLSLWASRRLSSRFGLRTGLEVSQNTARSASSVAFVGEQVPDLMYPSVLPTVPTNSLRTTTHRYRAASVPVEVSYSNPAKSGFSFYSRLGGVFTTLLNVHSEVEGNPEAARTYTLSSINSPYRHFSGSVRGGLGVSYRPAGHYWALNLGPVAEAGILSMNLDPSQEFWSQQRPYSFGLEAGVELGRAPKTQ